MFTAQQSFKQIFPQNGWVEHNPEDIWKTSIKVCKDAVSRSKKLRELSDVLKSSFILKNLDQEHNVLIEGIDNGLASGYSENYIKVLTKQENLRINDIVKVKAVEIRDFEMIGEKI